MSNENIEYIKRKIYKRKKLKADSPELFLYHDFYVITSGIPCKESKASTA